MPAHLSGHRRLQLLHPGLYERMSGLPHHGAPAEPRYLVIHDLRTLDLADKGRPRPLLEYGLGEYHHEHITPDDIALLVDNSYPVGVSVVRYPEVGLLLLYYLDKVLQIGRDCRGAGGGGEGAGRAGGGMHHLA